MQQDAAERGRLGASTFRFLNLGLSAFGSLLAASLVPVTLGPLPAVPCGSLVCFSLFQFFANKKK